MYKICLFMFVNKLWKRMDHYEDYINCYKNKLITLINLCKYYPLCSLRIN